MASNLNSFIRRSVSYPLDLHRNQSLTENTAREKMRFEEILQSLRPVCSVDTIPLVLHHREQEGKDTDDSQVESIGSSELDVLIRRFRESLLSTIQAIRELKNRLPDSSTKHTGADISYLSAFPDEELEQLEPAYDAIVEPDAILTISVTQLNKDSPDQEFKVLASQTLAQFRDSIYCLSPKLMQRLGSSSPLDLDQPHGIGDDMKAAIGSGYFMIDNIFYDDMRGSEAVKLSQSIVDWIKADPAREIQFGVPKQTSMSSTNWRDLDIAINKAFLYVHCGRCQHQFVIRDIRQYRPDLDVTNRNAYPRATFQRKLRRRRCHICDMYPAQWITVNDRLAPENPCLFCEKCYRPFHYDKQERLLYTDFHVYPYIHE